MSKKIKEIKTGTIIVHPKSGAEFKVVTYNETTEKLEAVAVADENITKKISQTTFNKMYSVKSVPVGAETKIDIKQVIKAFATNKEIDIVALATQDMNEAVSFDALLETNKDFTSSALLDTLSEMEELKLVTVQLEDGTAKLTDEGIQKLMGDIVDIPEQTQLPVDETVKDKVPVEDKKEPENVEKQEPVKEKVEPSVSIKKQKSAKELAIDIVRGHLIDYAINELGLKSTDIKETGSYVGLRVNNKNFAEVSKGKSSFTVTVMQEAVSQEQIDGLCLTVAPETYGWVLDTKYKLVDDADLESAKEILKSAFEVRKANPRLSRKKK